nr:hypothetical protein Itr_chr04CG14940 [Ipomoea trifida]
MSESSLLICLATIFTLRGFAMHLTKLPLLPCPPPLEVNIRRRRRRLGGEIDSPGGVFEIVIEDERRFRLGKGRKCGFWMRICGITTSFTVCCLRLSSRRRR